MTNEELQEMMSNPGVGGCVSMILREVIAQRCEATRSAGERLNKSLLEYINGDMEALGRFNKANDDLMRLCDLPGEDEVERALHSLMPPSELEIN